MIERKRTGFNRYRWECDVPGCPYSGSTDTLTRASVAPAVARRTEAPGSRERGDELVPVSRRPRCEHLALLATGQGDDEFRPRWLTLALPAILRGRTATPPVEVGFEVEDLLIVLRIDADGPTVRIGDDHLPKTVLVAEADTVVGLVAGALTVDQALDAGELRGEASALRRAFA